MSQLGRIKQSDICQITFKNANARDANTVPTVSTISEELIWYLKFSEVAYDTELGNTHDSLCRGTLAKPMT